MRAIKPVVHLEGHVSEEWWLRPAEVVASAAIENFAIVFDLKYEVLNHAFGQGHMPVNEDSEGYEVRVPVIEL